MTNIQNSTSFETLMIPPGTEVIKEFHTGESFPFKVKVTGEVFNYETQEHIAKVAKSILVKVDSSGPLFKFKEDTSWKGFEKMFTGTLNANLFSTNEAPLTGGLHLDLNIRP